MPQKQINTPTRIVYGMLRNGKSFSGRERNCCFFNTRGERFGDVSAVSGLDFDDDGRAAGVVDWDFDGDLDIWFVNRSGPQVRFLRNDVPPKNHWLAVLLQGTACNRDAVGARVELYASPQAQPLIKTLRAGDGFLSQSSKWLHFGLGPSATIDRVVVRWPGGEREVFAGLQADRSYRLVQGQAEPRAWAPPREAVSLKPSRLPRQVPADPQRIVLTEQLPLPRLAYRKLDGGSAFVSPRRATLLCLWASWCRPCVAELNALQQHRSELDEAGIDVLALSVDGLQDRRSDAAAARELLKRLQIDLPAGFAGSTLPDVLQLVQDELFDRRMPLGLPCSFLMDAQGRLAVIYRRNLEVEQVARDAELLSLGADELRKAALPFAGRWVEVPAPRRLLPIANKLREAGLVVDAWEYLKSLGSAVEGDPALPGLLLSLGDAMMAEQQTSEGILAFRKAVQVAPDSPHPHFMLGRALLFRGDARSAAEHFRKAAEADATHVNARLQLAWTLATSTEPTLRDPHAALRWAQEAVELTEQKDPEALDTLAVVLAALGRFEAALDTERQALELARSAGAAQLVETLQLRIAHIQHELEKAAAP